MGAHLGLKNTLEQAKLEMDAAAKAAKAEARSKSKTPAAQPTSKPEVAKPTEPQKSAPQMPAEPAKTAGLFDAPELAVVTASDKDGEEEILREAAEEDEAIDEGELDDAA